MMRFENVTASLTHEGGSHCFLKAASFTFPAQRLALIGSDEKEKNALVDVLLRRIPLQEGRIVQQPCTSFPLGRARPFLHAVSGTVMVKHLTALYGGQAAQNLALFQQLLSDANLLHKRLDHWPVLARQEFSLIAGLIGTFELYILEAVPEKISESFGKGYWPYLNHRLAGKAVLVNLRDFGFMKRFCEGAIVLAQQQLIFEAEVRHRALLNRAAACSPN
jgi:capsular polysaccharide transport system ATP-binding protein